jgi:shikimate kinase
MGNIYLVGFMGTGKTAVGRELAKRKKWQFLDLDELIELKERRSISDIFSQEGEPYFRRIEKKVLKEASKERKFVYACGGGIVIDKENIKVMKETGVIICLTATAEVVLKRTSGYAHRPLLNVANPKKQIELLLKLRAPYYAQADKAIDTSKLSVEQVVEKVIKVTTSPVKRQKEKSLTLEIIMLTYLGYVNIC